MPVRFRRELQRPLLPSLLLATLLGAACATSPPAPAAQADAPPGARAFLWEVQSAQPHGGLMYLVGSVHVAHEDAQSLPPAMVKAFVLSDELVVEADVTALNAAKLWQLTQEYSLLPEGQRLSQQLEPETAKLLADTAERHGISMERLERMRPWAAAITLPALASSGASAAPGPGVDMLFLENAQGTKPIVELETTEEQFQIFAGLSEHVQERMLRDHLLHLEKRQEEFERLETAWKAGDAEAMEAEVFRQEKEDPELRPLYERLYYERNTRMAGKLGEMLAQPRVYFVVVGAGHVVGPRGLVALLRKQGHRVRQLPRD